MRYAPPMTMKKVKKGRTKKAIAMTTKDIAKIITLISVISSSIMLVSPNNRILWPYALVKLLRRV